MKLTFITEHFPPDQGGVATSSLRLATTLARSSHNVQVLTFDKSRPLADGDYQQREFHDGFEVIRFGPFFSGHPELTRQPLPTDTSSRENLRAMFRRRVCDNMMREAALFAPEAVLAFYVLNAGFLARFVAAQLAVPCFVGVRGNDVGLGIFNLQRFAAVHWTLEGAAAVICVNHYLRNRVISVLPNSAERTFVVANAVCTPETQDRSEASRKLKAATSWDDAAFVVVFIGALREKKGVIPLLQAMKKLADTSVRLLIVGPPLASIDRRLCGAEWDELVRCGQIYCTGQVERHEVVTWAAAGNAVIMPSLDDGLPNGLLEGMSFGLCPIVSLLFQDVILDGQNGFLFDAHSPDDIAAVLRRLANDRALTAHVGEVARMHVARHHTPDREAQGYVDIITRFLPQSRDSNPPKLVVE